MENFSYAASYPDSGHSSPRSRDVDFERSSPQMQWEDSNTFNNNKFRFMCSYGGKIQPRTHDNSLSYVGGDTKILAVDRSVSLSSFLSKLRSVLSSSSDAEVSFKYQLPGEDLDALISVTNDDDLHHMMSEYDRLCQASPSKPARLRLFLFPVASTQPPPPQPARDERKFAVVPPSPAVASTNLQPSDADFLFGLEKPVALLPKPREPVAVPETQTAVERVSSPDPNMVPPDIQRHIRDLQRLQIQDQAAFQFQRRSEEPVGYYVPNLQEKSPPPVYWSENQVGGAVGFPAASGGERPVYVVPASAGLYHTPPPGAHAPPQGFYQQPVRRTGSDVYREVPASYGVFAGAEGELPQRANMVAYSDGMGMGRPAAEMGYPQVAYDSAGRQMYYTAPYSGMAGMTAGMRQQSGPFTPEGKVVARASQNSM